MNKSNSLSNAFNITIVIDDPKSWMNDFVSILIRSLSSKGHEVSFVSDPKQIKSSTFTFFLSCQKIVSADILSKSKHNLVVHESDLPKGKGWSPLTYQVLEGKNKIPICLFEAATEVDSGNIYFKDSIDLDGTELVDGLRKKQAHKTFELIEKFVSLYPKINSIPQSGTSSFYPKRTPKDSQLDTNRSISEQFNLLRVVDNDRYPAYFILNGKKYLLKIYEAD